jgi:hypothetical protein
LFCDDFDHGNVTGDVVITAAGSDHGSFDSVNDVWCRIISWVHFGTALLADKHGVPDRDNRVASVTVGVSIRFHFSFGGVVSECYAGT